MRLSYLGLGEPLCFMSFGPFATIALYLLIIPIYVAIDSGVISFLISTISILVGLSSTLILFCSHFHQAIGDCQSGKTSPIVKFGTVKSSVIMVTSIYIYIALEIALIVLKAMLSISLFIYSISLTFTSYLTMLVWYNHNEPVSVASLKIFAALWHSINGILIVSSLITNSCHSNNIL